MALLNLRERLAPRPVAPERSRRFRHDGHGRFWWHTLERTDYVPALYASLSDSEWRLMEDWYAETLKRDSIGEINVPAMSFIHGLVSGNGVTRIAQCGGYYGYSTLLIGFMLRAMDVGGMVVSIDIDPEATKFSEKYVKRAGLEQWVRFHVGDSADPASRRFALDQLGGDPELLLIDSSHQYAHTLRELDLWIPALPPGAIALLHDTSDFARDFDPTREGGVKRAVEEWMPEHPEIAFLSLNGAHPWGTGDGNAMTYKDGCGLGIMQRLPV